MSRVRPIDMPNGERIWFDTKKNGERATAEQLELLATAEELDLDDLLDEDLSQGDILLRLRKALGQGSVPPEVIARRKVWREQRSHQPACRVCGKKGDSTRHHFINKWILRELEYYEQKWADRSKNTIPLCIDCHRQLHSRYEEATSIASFLTDDERAFAEAALSALADERPKLLILIGRGSDTVYESRLIKDWMEGRFKQSKINRLVGKDAPQFTKEFAKNSLEAWENPDESERILPTRA